MHFLKKLIPQKIKNIYHLAQAVLANFLYGFPSKSIKVIGITGTNGKTTTVQMIARILEETGARVAVISTINFKIGDKEWVNKTKFTTLSSFAVQKFILSAVKARCKYLILEVSSHSLDQYRLWGINFDIAVITNVTREHLDYHKTMEEYRKAKLKLFRKANVAVVNLDMEKPEEFLGCCAENIFGYSLKIPNPKSQFPNKSQCPNSKFQKLIAENVESGINYSKFIISGHQFKINLPGLFNVENALAATCVGLAYYINLQTIVKALEKIKGIPGRMEYVPNDKGLNIIVDYAVTPDSLDKLYNLIKNIRSNSLSFAPHSRIVSVLGACGERDRGKRPIMGEIVSRYANYIILTNEDPYNEDPQRIINEIEAGIKNKPACRPASPNRGEQGRELEKDYWKIMDRREAIKKALVLAELGDFLIVTGKGAEETMAVGNKIIPWNDKKIIQEVLRELS